MHIQIQSLAVGACQVYNIREGCAGDDTCSGVVVVTGGQPGPTEPTRAPTPVPLTVTAVTTSDFATDAERNGLASVRLPGAQGVQGVQGGPGRGYAPPQPPAGAGAAGGEGA